MVKPVKSEELEVFVNVIAQFSDGAAIGDILKAFNGTIGLRLAQRRLAALIKSGQIVVTGKARALRYRLSHLPEINSDVVLRMKPISFSEEAKAIQAKIKRPVAERGSRVGYNRKFLHQYEPNKTFYLSEENRKYLRVIGKVPDGERPAGSYAREVLNRLLIDLSWNSSRLVGNTYSLLETERLLELGEEADEKSHFEALMIINHKSAIEFLVESIGNIGFNRRTILTLHAHLSRGLLQDLASSGALRKLPVGIGQSVYHPPTVPLLIEECFDEILTKANVIQDPFEQAFFVMIHLPYLQPFIDVNKRVSRLSMNIPLFRDNFSPLSFVNVPEDLYKEGTLAVYELNEIVLLKEVFIWAYEQSCMRYSATREVLGQPKRIDLLYRKQVEEVINAVVREGLDKKRAIAFIRKQAVAIIPSKDQSLYIEEVENSLEGLHEGNCALYRLQPSELHKWKQVW